MHAEPVDRLLADLFEQLRVDLDLPPTPGSEVRPDVWPNPRDRTINPNVAPMTRVTRYPDTNGVVTMITSGAGADAAGNVEGSVEVDINPARPRER
jgi:hypothetical protein